MIGAITNIILGVLFGMPIIVGLFIWLFPAKPRSLEPVKPNLDRYDSKMLVALSDCEISYALGSTQTEYTPYPRASILPLLESKNFDQYTELSNTNIYSTCVKFKKGSEVYVSGAIAKDPVTVEALLMQKKTTYIYFRSTDPGDYYFDLDFING